MNQNTKTKTELKSELNAAILLSGGKDSVYAFHLAKISGFSIKCLIKLVPESNESMMFHHPFTKEIDFGKVLGVPLIDVPLSQNDDELAKLKEGLAKAKSLYNINYVITGAIASEYQRMRINFICEELNLKTLSPLWHKDQKRIIEEQVDVMKVQVVSITAFGLDKNLLDKPLSKEDLDKINQSKYVTNKAFEGGEAETLVLDAPEYKYSIEIKDKKIFSESENQHYLNGEIMLVKK